MGPSALLNWLGRGPSNFKGGVLKKGISLTAESNRLNSREDFLFSKAEKIQNGPKLGPFLKQDNYDGQLRRWSAPAQLAKIKTVGSFLQGEISLNGPRS